MSLTEYAVNFFVALFALLDPIGNVPVFAAATAGALAAGRRWVAVYISLFAFLFMTFFFFSGLALLEFFGISLPAFRIAGGVILFLMGLEMARDDFTAMFADAAEGAETEGARAYADTDWLAQRDMLPVMLVAPCELIHKLLPDDWALALMASQGARFRKV